LLHADTPNWLLIQFEDSYATRSVRRKVPSQTASHEAELSHECSCILSYPLQQYIAPFRLELMTAIRLARKAAQTLLIGFLWLTAVLFALLSAILFALYMAKQESDGNFYLRNHGTAIEVSAVHTDVADHLYLLFLTISLSIGIALVLIPRLRARASN
jgi:hypothetical protein